MSNQTEQHTRSGFAQMVEYQQRLAQLAYRAGDTVIVCAGEGADHNGIIVHIDPLVPQPYYVKLGNGYQVQCAEHELVQLDK